MAINWRAGLEEVEKSGQILGQGFTQLGQQQAQFGERMANMKMQQNEMKAKYDAQARQESQQMFNTAIDAVNNYGKMKMQREEMEMRKVADARAAEEHQQRKTVFDQQQAMQKAQAKATVEMNHVKGELQGPQPTEELQGKALIGEGDKIAIPDYLKDADDLQKASYIQTIKNAQTEEATALAAKEEKEFERKNKLEQIGLQKRAQALNEAKFKEEQAKDKSDAAIKFVENLGKTIADTQGKLSQLSENRDSVYSINATERQLKSNDEKKKGISEDIAAITKARDSKNELLKIAGVPLKDEQGNPTPLTPDVLKSVIEKAEKGGPEVLARAQKVYTTMLFMGKEPGMAAGGFTAGEYSMMGGRTGAQALSYLDTLDPASPIFTNVWNNAMTNFKREGGLTVMAETLNQNEQRGMESTRMQLSASGGLANTPKNDRDTLLYQLLPESKREKNPFDQFRAQDIEKQASLVYGPDAAKQMNLREAKRNDYLAEHPEEAARSLKLQAIQEPVGYARTPETMRAYEQAKNVLNLSQVRNREEAQVAPTSSGVAVPANGSYVMRDAGNGTFKPVEENNGLPFYVRTPLTQPKVVNGVKMGSFGGK